MDLQLFIPITKIDVAQRLVYGTIAEEIPDHADEIMDYASAKPMFEAWSQEIEKASRGRSVGNLRAMHGSVAAGKLDQIHFDDDARRIATVAKVVDDAEWKKVLEGVYTGFSMGGRYVQRWPDPENPSLTRYTPQPMEVSLVDHPCIPSATFEVVKADGTIELRKFKRSAAERDVTRDAAEFADPGYQTDRKKRYPLDTEAHIRAAWGYIHHPKNQAPYTADQLAQIKARIVAAWKAKIDKKGPPLAAGKNTVAAVLAKNLSDVSQLALIIDDLSQIAAELDDPSVGDGSLGSLKTTIESLVALLNSLVDQATSGLTGNDAPDTDNDDVNDGAQTAAHSEDGDEDTDDDGGDECRCLCRRRRRFRGQAGPRCDEQGARCRRPTHRCDGRARCRSDEAPRASGVPAAARRPGDEIRDGHEEPGHGRTRRRAVLCRSARRFPAASGAAARLRPRASSDEARLAQSALTIARAEALPQHAPRGDPRGRRC